jgi:predicted HAD superfamily Cof-like phosphohydrolase
MSYFTDVRDWHQAFDVPVADRPTQLDPERLSLRVRLMAEEWGEFCDELILGWTGVADLANVAKEAADLVVTVLGTLAEVGIPFDQVWDAVHASNMAKLGPGGQVKRRADGKILKPPGWQPPNIQAILTGPEVEDRPGDGVAAAFVAGGARPVGSVVAR